MIKNTSSDLSDMPWDADPSETAPMSGDPRILPSKKKTFSMLREMVSDMQLKYEAALDGYRPGTVSYKNRLMEARDAYESLIALLNEDQSVESPDETKALPPLCDGAVQVIYEHGEPKGVRDASGYLCFFNRVTKWPGQEERYRKELALRARYAEVIANALRSVQETESPCPQIVLGDVPEKASEQECRRSGLSNTAAGTGTGDPDAEARSSRREVTAQKALPDSHKATCEGGTGGPCTQPDCEKCWDDEGRAVNGRTDRG